MSLGSKRAGRIVSDKSYLESSKCINTTLWSRKKSKNGKHCSVEQQNNKSYLLWGAKMTKHTG